MSLFKSLQRAKEKIEAKIDEQRPKIEQRFSTPQQGRLPPPVPPRLPHIPPRPPADAPAIPPRPPPPPSANQAYVNAVYYPSWLVYKDKPPSWLDVGNITHVFYSFMGVNEDGTLRHFDEWADLNKEVDGEKGGLTALAKLKHKNPHLRTIVSIGGGSGSKEFPALAASEHARRTFAHQVRKFCDRYNFNGVDIDWEHPKNTEEGHHFLQLLQACRDALPERDYFLTTALPVGEYVLKHIDLCAVSRIVNYLNLMAYDFTGSWTEVCGNHAQLHSTGSDVKSAFPVLRTCTSSCVDYILSRGFPNRKLLLGIPSYARFFPNARGLGQKFDNAGEIDYAEIPDEWVENAHVDERAVAAWYVDRGEQGFLSFDVPRTVRIKARYATSRNLGGLFYWTGTGDKRGHLSLVAAGKHTLESA
ncbi:Chitinase 1 [Cladobotryum mycophilum]|uniref:chitinase n=1 Tax=Cladobotryum mycophilum TaxID=491253 RepID=A0ABR0SQY4_9HYPO